MFSHRTDWQLTPNRFTQVQQELRAAGREVLDLTISNPTRAELHYDAETILQALSNPKAMDYDPQSKGLRSAREAVAAYYRTRREDIDPESIILTTSTSEGYSYVLRLLCNGEDEILVPKPSYPLFEFLADLQDVKLVSYPLLYDHGWQIDFASLRTALTPRSRAVLVVHPNNPTGSFVKPREAAELGELCAAREMAIVADEVFLDYVAGAQPACTFARSVTALTFTLSGLSKISLLPQMKLAWTVISGPQAMVQNAVDRLEIIADTYLSPSAPVQLALPKFLSIRQEMQAQLQRRISANLSALDAMLRDSKSLERLDREGGWYAILRVPVTATDDDLTIALLERNSVLVHPGHFFNFPREGFLVLSLITAECEFQDGVVRLLKFFNGNSGNLDH